MSSYIIQTEGLSFSYTKNSKKILDAVTLKIPKGSIYGFLGANGAGKSTTMQLLIGSLVSKDESIFLFEEELEKQLPTVFKKVGCLIESPSLYTHLTGYDNLLYIAKMKGVSFDEIDNTLELVGLSHTAKQKVSQYSMGMRQRLGIGIALLGKPDLLLLDEPINGLDPQGVIDVRELLIKLNKELGITIFISSHLLDEIERVCTHIGVINNGKLVFDGTIDELKEITREVQKIYITLKEAKKWFENLKEKYRDIDLEGNTICIQVNSEEEIRKIMISILSAGATITEIKTNEGLEDLFLHLIK